MALSNIRREPRRELIEQALGTVLFFGYAGIVYWASGALFGAGWYDTTTDLGYAAERAFTIFLILLGTFIVGVIIRLSVVFMHWLGERICAVLAVIGLDPRPRQRY